VLQGEDLTADCGCRSRCARLDGSGARSGRRQRWRTPGGEGHHGICAGGGSAGDLPAGSGC